VEIFEKNDYGYIIFWYFFIKNKKRGDLS